MSQNSSFASSRYYSSLGKIALWWESGNEASSPDPFLYLYLALWPPARQLGVSMLSWSIWMCSWTHLSEITSYLSLGALVCKLECSTFSFMSLSPFSASFSSFTPYSNHYNFVFYLGTYLSSYQGFLYCLPVFLSVLENIYSTCIPVGYCHLFSLFKCCFDYFISWRRIFPALYIHTCCSSFKKLFSVGDYRRWAFHFLYLLGRLGWQR